MLVVLLPQQTGGQLDRQRTAAALLDVDRLEADLCLASVREIEPRLNLKFDRHSIGLADQYWSNNLVTAPNGEAPVLAVATGGRHHRDHVDDPQRCEHFVPRPWRETAPIAEARYEIGLFGNQNSVCQPTVPNWCSPVERLKQRLPTSDQPPTI